MSTQCRVPSLLILATRAPHSPAAGLSAPRSRHAGADSPGRSHWRQPGRRAGVRPPAGARAGPGRAGRGARRMPAWGGRRTRAAAAHAAPVRAAGPGPTPAAAPRPEPALTRVLLAKTQRGAAAASAEGCCGGFPSSGGLRWDVGHLLPEVRAEGLSQPWEQRVRGLCGLKCRGCGHQGTLYLVDIGHHVGGGAPARAELAGQGLPLLGEHMCVQGVHQHRHHTQALLLQRVEHHQEPAGGHTGMAAPAPQCPTCSTPSMGPVHPLAAPHGPTALRARLAAPTWARRPV